MGLIKLNCSNCGAELEFDEKQKTGFCSHCGTKHILEDVNNTTINNVTNNVSNEYKINNAIINNGPSEDNLLKRALEFKEQKDILNAYVYANKVLDINSENKDAKNIINNSFYLNGKYLTALQVNQINDLVLEHNQLTNNDKTKKFHEIVVLAESFVCGYKKWYANCNFETINLITIWSKQGIISAYKEAEKNEKLSVSSEQTNNSVKLKPWHYIVIACAFIVVSTLFGIISSCAKNDSKRHEVNMDTAILYEDISYRVSNAEIVKFFPNSVGGYYSTKNTDYYYMHITFVVKNNSNYSKRLYLSDYSLVTPNGNIYDPTDYVYIYNRMYNEYLGAGHTETYYIVYKIDGIEAGEYKFRLNLLKDEPDPQIILNGLEIYEDSGIISY